MSETRWRVVLINPNTDQAITARMAAAADMHSRGRLDVHGLTAPFGASLLTTEADLEIAEKAVGQLLPEIGRRYDGVIISAFGDPGLPALRSALTVPVVGIGEASMKQAAGLGRFCVATTTPGLESSIDKKAAQLGLSALYAGVVLTEGDAEAVTGDPSLLEERLFGIIDHAMRALAVDAVVVGGGPMTDAARSLAGRLPIPVVDPVEAAVTRLLAKLEDAHFSKWNNASA